jgi:hypothetical protein
VEFVRRQANVSEFHVEFSKGASIDEAVHACDSVRNEDADVASIHRYSVEGQTSIYRACGTSFGTRHAMESAWRYSRKQLVVASW